MALAFCQAPAEGQKISLNLLDIIRIWRVRIHKRHVFPSLWYAFH